MSAKLKAAIDYADMGFRVFPCLPDSKEPATKHGCLDATDDVDQIERWWDHNPEYNVAISTDGWLIVDVDPGGRPWLDTVNSDDMLRGSMARTPRGGSHHWFRQNGQELHNTAGKLALGVDTRANGGYVLVPPSTVGGKPYMWVNELTTDQPTVPAWLIEMLGVHQPVRESVGEEVVPGTRNHVMFRFAGYLRRAGMTAAEMLPSLEKLNQERCKPPLGEVELWKIAENAARYEPDAVEQALLLSHIDAVPDEDFEPDEPLAEFPKECLDEMPPVMQEAFEYVIESAIKPQPEITLGALVALFGAAFGQKVEDDYGTRTNVMILGIAPSGGGKEHPRQCNKELMFGSGMDAVNAPERIGSHAGIVSAVSHHSIRLFQLDEIGRLLATMRDPKVSHLYNVGTVLMALYSSSNTVWIGDAYADLSKVKTIKQPHVCVFGTSVPDSLYSGLSPENLTDGLVGRLIIFQSMDIPDRQKPDRRKSVLPFRVTETLREWTAFKPPGSGNLGTTPMVVNKTEEANARHESYCDVVNAKHRTEDAIASAVWARAPEKAAKLALIHACCQAPRADADEPPVVTLESENWGIKLANYSTRLVLQAARNSVSGSKYEADLKYVFAAITGEMSLTQISKRTRRLKPRERTEILGDLVGNGAVEIVNLDTGGRPKAVYRKRRRTL